MLDWEDGLLDWDLGGIKWRYFRTVSYENFLIRAGATVSADGFRTEYVGAGSPHFWVFKGFFGEVGCSSTYFSLGDAVGEGYMIFNGDSWIKGSSVMSCCGWVDSPADGSTPREPK